MLVPMSANLLCWSIDFWLQQCFVAACRLSLVVMHKLLAAAASLVERGLPQLQLQARSPASAV